MANILSNNEQIGIDKAKSIRNKYKHIKNLSDIIFQICEDYQIKIKEADKKSNTIYDFINDRYEITLSYNQSKARDNFEIALELGHILLNHSLTGNALIYRPKSPEDIQAKGFALEFLLPKEIFIIKYNELDRDVHKLAKYFEVSPPLILVAMIMYKIK